jgi:hypothetical protein
MHKRISFLVYQMLQISFVHSCLRPKTPCNAPARRRAAYDLLYMTTTNINQQNFYAQEARSKHQLVHTTQHPNTSSHAHSHCANTHHLALRSASTNPLHVPFSPILITVSHAVPSASLVLVKCSFLRVNRMILPDGVWIASLAGFMPLLPEQPDEACDGFV